MKLKKCNVELEVKYNYNREDQTYYQPTDEDVELLEVEIVSGSLLDILDNYTKCQEVIDEIEIFISEYERDRSK